MDKNVSHPAVEYPTGNAFLRKNKNRKTEERPADNPRPATAAAAGSCLLDSAGVIEVVGIDSLHIVGCRGVNPDVEINH